MFSHKHLYEDEPNDERVASQDSGNGLLKRGDVDNPLNGASAASGAVGISTASNVSVDDVAGAVKDSSAAAAGAADNDDEEEEDLLGFTNAIIWLGIITVFIAILSDAISASIEDAAGSMGISSVFIAAIILPIVGNAAEHAGAVMFAVKGKLDLSLGVAIGSSTQIALCVLPLLVILGWMGGYDLSLDFGGFEAGTLLLSVISVTFAIKDGHSNWLLGMTLVAMYIVIAIGFWAHDNEDLN
jgi:calcium/proton exchanger cax